MCNSSSHVHAGAGHFNQQMAFGPLQISQPARGKSVQTGQGKAWSHAKNHECNKVPVAETGARAQHGQPRGKEERRRGEALAGVFHSRFHPQSHIAYDLPKSVCLGDRTRVV
eukprot:3661051-Rhodomonas_salina.1